MKTLKYALLSLITIVALASCEKDDPNCVQGTWRNNQIEIVEHDSIENDSIFYHDEFILNADNSGELYIDSRGCNDSVEEFKKNSVFNWTQSDGVLTITYHDSIISNCTGLNIHSGDSVYTIAYSCTDVGLWMSGVVWEKQ